MFLNVELHTATLDRGIPGVSPTEMLLIFAMMLLISMVPYFFLYVSLRPKRSAVASAKNSFSNVTGWLHNYRRHELLHH